MKALLRAFSWLSVLAGFVLALYVLFQSRAITGEVGFGAVLAVAYFIGGLGGFAIFGGIAEILDRVENLANKDASGIVRGAKATYLPGFDPDDPNPPGWNDPK